MGSNQFDMCQAPTGRHPPGRGEVNYELRIMNYETSVRRSQFLENVRLYTLRTTKPQRGDIPQAGV